jgi:hypothetical protein
VINTNFAGLELNFNAVSGNPRIRFSVRSVSTDARQNMDGVTNVTTGQWIPVGGYVSFGTDFMQVWYNGAVDNSGTVTFANNSYTFGTPNAGASDSFGGYFSAGPSTNSQFNGDLAEIAIWRGGISDDAFVSLAKGFDARLIRPILLWEYWPLVREHHGIVNSIIGTVTGSIPVTDHPRIIR